jgi:hypothetical protein
VGVTMAVVDEGFGVVDGYGVDDTIGFVELLDILGVDVGIEVLDGVGVWEVTTGGVSKSASTQ